MKSTLGAARICIWMSYHRLLFWFIFAAMWLALACLSRGANLLQILSARAPSATVPAGGNAGSDLPIISADGRYVVFASTAANLVTNPNAGPVSARAPRALQVFVRDRLAGATTLVSANTAGLPAGADCFPDAISTNGQYVLFESTAGDLVNGNSNNLPNIFLRDIINQQTVLISANTNGFSGNGASRNAVMTPDAHFIAFSSAANNLVAADTNGIPDVFIRDRVGGTTTLVSGGVLAAGPFSQVNGSDSPDITPDGRYVSFYTAFTNSTTDAISAGQVFVCDTSTGTTYWASTNAQSLFQSVYGTTNAVACNQHLSTNGQYIVFEACTNPPLAVTAAYGRGLVLRYNTQTGTTDLVATNATVPGLLFPDINTLDITPDGRFIAYVAATNLGSPPANVINLWDGQSATTSLISQNRNGGVSAGDTALWPRLDATGRYVAFIAAAANLVTNNVSGYNCYLRDTQAGTTTLVNVDANNLGTGVDSLTPPALCSDGHLIAFVAGDGNLVPNDDNNATDIFVRDINAGTTELESVHSPAQADDSTGFVSGFSSFSPNYNGLYAAFTSEGALVPADTNGLRDVYLRDVVNGTNILISVNTNGVAGSEISSEPSVDATGRYVVFSSAATDLVAGDTNKSRDVFLRDTVAGKTSLVSRNMAGTGEGNSDSYTPLISADARYVLFYSTANNLASGSFSAGSINLFLRDLKLGTNYALTFSGATVGTWSANADRVAYEDVPALKVYVWDCLSAKRVFTNSISALGLASLSPDGADVAWIDSSLHVANIASNATVGLISGPFPGRAGLQFSADDRYFAYAAISSGSSQVYFEDLTAGTNMLVSHAYNSSSAANGTSDSPVISPDGRYIVYRTFATNIVPPDANEVDDLMVYDRSNAISTLITSSAYGSRTGNNRSTQPLVSADGKNILFTSWASDLLTNDFNPGSDVFLLSLPGSSVPGAANSGMAGTLVAGLQLFPLIGSNSVPTLSWPAQYGASYQIQYKNDLGDPVWHNVSGDAGVVGSLGEAIDLNPSVSNRFYRVILGN